MSSKKISTSLLIEKGYFFKELPPAFNAIGFAENFNSINKKWDKIHQNELSKLERKKYNESKCIMYSIPKKKYSRRVLKLPNPLHYSKLSEEISNNWDELEKHFKKSKFSCSYPLIDGGKRAVIASSITVSDFKEKCIENSFDKLYELQIDISKFYDTVYTHSISWALHTKKLAKEKRNDKKNKLLGDILDDKIRYCQVGQSIGIPVGPDTSFIISEVILCEIDMYLKTKFPSLKGCRFADDFHLYLSSEEEAHKVLKFTQSLLNEYQLGLNDEKIKISKFPYEVQDSWVNSLKYLNIRESISGQKSDILNYFNEAFRETKLHSKSVVLKYAIQKFKRIDIYEENWKIFESLLHKCIIAEPEIIIDVLQIFFKYSNLINKKNLEKVINQILDIHCPMRHDYEITWALWMAKSFGCKIKKSSLESVFEGLNSFSCLIALELYHRDLIFSAKENIDLTNLTNQLLNSSLFDENWLLIYEASIKKWLILDEEIIESNKYFKLLKSEGISFYNTEIQVENLIEKNKAKKHVKNELEVPEEEIETSEFLMY